ncbi:TPA: hypothetical protein OO122_001659 [Legionella pneumophila]|nr:hypothetical protein [Legionella pneumophila]HAT2067879.1 hypothetical protein [Legionella pneumophila]HAT8594002.1 hypothetical protein [Legionella pneumophila]HAU1578117.1 hypothetical protein [Legionella pneumophila]HAU1682181.1 hypothetical protein [Legionella pneumophila]HAU3701747.1 hypothetical protein [Legionella pneumophila]
MKKTVSLMLTLGLGVAFADQQADDLNAKRIAWSKAYLEKQGLPVPDGGVKILPEKEMSSYSENKEQRMKIKKDIKTYGYIKSDSPSTEQLLHLKITAQHDLKAHADDYDPKSTHLKRSVADLKMAYTPTQIPSSVADTYIGAAPYLTYLKDQGWVGAIQFFSNKGVGNCSFSENNVKLSHGSIVIAKEDVRNDINGKTTTVEVMGTPNSGFTYTVEWFDDTFFRKIECANKHYSSQLTNSVIKIAQSIDNG